MKNWSLQEKEFLQRLVFFINRLLVFCENMGKSGQQGETMKKDFKALVHKIKKDHGDAVLTDIALLRSFLKDYAAGNYKGEIRNFLLVMEEGLVARLRNEKHVSVAFLQTQASYFASTYSLTEDGARLVVWAWAEVLGLWTQGQKEPPLSVSASGTAQAGQSSYTNSIGMEFVLVPAGKFARLAGAEIFGKDEFYKVTITKPFFLGKYPVTQEEWYAVMGNNPSRFKGRKNPVENVSWNDAKEFIRKLNQKEGTDKYRLSTEAEWEHAARAGSSTEYCFGDHEGQLDAYAWYNKNSGRSTHPVGEKKPNAWGLYDMHGNVWEWAEDWYGNYPAESLVDPKGPNSGDFRVLRGGSWNSNAQNCRSAYRHNNRPDLQYSNIGFRLAFSSGQ